MARAVNDAGLSLLKSFEQCDLKAYLGQERKLTIGWGHTGEDVHEDSEWTQEKADAVLVVDTATAAWQVDRNTHDVPTTDNQFSAMVCFAFNIGTGAFVTTTVLRQHRAARYALAANSFLLWDNVHNGTEVVHSDGLQRRREAEKALYLSQESQFQV